MQGALLSSCAAAGQKCTALLIPTLGQGPDPEGAAILLDALNRVVPSIKIDTSSLKEEAEMIREHMAELLKMHQHQMNAYERAGSTDVDQMYK
jgi:predicted ATP-grasp superfamily ATP-dependent carboligase